MSAARDQATTVLGQPVSLPVMISPTGVQAVNPDGEVAVARAAAAAGTAMGLSSFASKSIEDVIAANPATFFKIYWLGDRARIRPIVDRAEQACAKGLIVTLDWTFAHRRDWGSPSIPERLDVRAMIKLAPEALARPRWLAEFVRSGKLPDLTAPNLTPPGGEAPTFCGAYGEWIQTPLPSWDDIAWLREEWADPSWSRASCTPTTRAGPWTSARRRSRSPTTAATISTGHPLGSGAARNRGGRR